MTEVAMDLARELFAKGHSLGEIARQLDCSIHDLSPWLYADEMRGILDRAQRWPRNAPPDRDHEVEEAWGILGKLSEHIDWSFPSWQPAQGRIYDWSLA